MKEKELQAVVDVCVTRCAPITFKDTSLGGSCVITAHHIWLQPSQEKDGHEVNCRVSQDIHGSCMVSKCKGEMKEG